MRRYGTDYDRGFGAQEALPRGGGRGSGYGGRADADAPGRRARERQVREERLFQRSRAAPGEEAGWSGGGPIGASAPGAESRRRSPGDWQPSSTPTAGDLMTENPAAVTPGSSLADAARTMRDLDVGILPVVDDLQSRRLQGVITDRDIAIRAVAEGSSGAATVADCMTPDARSCHPDDRVRDVLHVMEREQVRRVPIVDHAGTLVGIIAQADLAVEFAAGEEHRALRVESAIERISAPARPRRGRPA